MAFVPIKLNGKSLRLHKAIIEPALGSKNVLTNSPWEFVELWLTRNRKDRALFYWRQSREFSRAASGLPTQSSPLLLYYSFMNAIKALLSAKGVTFVEHHGVKSTTPLTRRKINLSNELIKILNSGVLPSLSSFLKESESKKEHSLQELLFNIPCIHRTYCLTYASQKDMFIPLRDCTYLYDKVNRQAFFECKLSVDFASRHTVKRLPPSLILANVNGRDYVLRSKVSINFSSASKPTQIDIQNLSTLHKDLRSDLHYINGTQTLWYVKGLVNGPRRLSRFPLTLTLAAMHRLSELCRYRPEELNSFLSGQKNWLLSEFIQQSPQQFLDEVASEITGHQFLIPNTRPAA